MYVQMCILKGFQDSDSAAFFPLFFFFRVMQESNLGRFSFHSLFAHSPQSFSFPHYDPGSDRKREKEREMNEEGRRQTRKGTKTIISVEVLISLLQFVSG